MRLMIEYVHRKITNARNYDNAVYVLHIGIICLRKLVGIGYIAAMD